MQEKKGVYPVIFRAMLVEPLLYDEQEKEGAALLSQGTILLFSGHTHRPFSETIIFQFPPPNIYALGY